MSERRREVVRGAVASDAETGARRRIFRGGESWTDHDVERARLAYCAGGYDAVMAVFPTRSRGGIRSFVRRQKSRDRDAWVVTGAEASVAPEHLPRFDSRSLAEAIYERHRVVIRRVA